MITGHNAADERRRIVAHCRRYRRIRRPMLIFGSSPAAAASGTQVVTGANDGWRS